MSTSAHRTLFTLALAAVLGGCAKGKRADPGVTSGEAVRISSAHALAYEASLVKDPAKAGERYENALERYDDFPAAWNNLGVSLMAQGKYLEAEQAFARAAEQGQKDPRPLFNRGLLWMKRHYPADARVHFKKALERDAYYLPALRGAIECDVLLRDTGEETLDNIRRALMLEKDKKWLVRLESQRVKIQANLNKPETARSLEAVDLALPPEIEADMAPQRPVTDRERQMIEDALKAKQGGASPDP